MKIVKVKKVKRIDDSQDILKMLNNEIRQFCQKIDRGVGYIVRDDIMRQFHDMTDDKWRVYLIDQRKLKNLVEKAVNSWSTVYEKEPDEEY